MPFTEEGKPTQMTVIEMWRNQSGVFGSDESALFLALRFTHWRTIYMLVNATFRQCTYSLYVALFWCFTLICF